MGVDSLQALGAWSRNPFLCGQAVVRYSSMDSEVAHHIQHLKLSGQPKSTEKETT